MPWAIGECSVHSATIYRRGSTAIPLVCLHPLVRHVLSVALLSWQPTSRCCCCSRDAPLRSSASRALCLGTLYPRAHCYGFLGPELRRGCAKGSVYVWRRAAAVVEELAGQVWWQLIVLLVHTSIVCPCSQRLHSPFIAKPHYLFDLRECNTVSGAGVEGEAVVIDQHGDHDV